MRQSNKRTEALKYQREFWISVIRYLPHRFFLVLFTRLHADYLTSALCKLCDRKLGRSRVKVYSDKKIREYLGVVEATKLWHGSGRFQYVDEEIVDTFEAILKSGSLNPVRDVYAVLVGGEEMASVSTSPLRIISRSYADTHGKGKAEKNRYGTSIFWAAYYYSLFYAEIFIKHGIAIVWHWSQWSSASSSKTGERLWGKKVNKNAKSVWDVFGSGSDIPGNHPILFGIAHHNNVAKLPKAIAKVETRLIDPVKLSDLSHIEVPEDRVQEIKILLSKAGYSVRVSPIELGEYVSSKQSISVLVGLETARLSM